jgi:tetratricopeptide (TPR) repeat protein
VAIDREAALKRAEKFLRQGKLDGAIEEYVRLIEEQPRDWASINALGDLYVRAGNTDRAAEQFTRVADFLFAEGFLPKAQAVYKKALKIHSTHEHTLLRLVDIAVQQKIFVDARQYLRQLGDQRRFLGDSRGAAECLVRLGKLEDADAEAKLAAARAAQTIGEMQQASELLNAAAQGLAKQNRRAEALDVWVEAAQLDPADVELRARVARECLAAGQSDRARAFLTADTAGDDPELLLAVAESALAAGNDEQARQVITRVIMQGPDHAGSG